MYYEPKKENKESPITKEEMVRDLEKGIYYYAVYYYKEEFTPHLITDDSNSAKKFIQSHRADVENLYVKIPTHSGFTKIPAPIFLSI